MTTATNDDKGVIATASDPRLFTALLVIANVAGTLKHHWEQTGVSGRYATQLAAASATPATTPLVDATTAFANGGGIEAATLSAFDCDVAAQTSDTVLVALPIYNDSGTAVLVNATLRALDINSVTRTRAALVFSVATTGAAFSLNTTNIPTGKEIAVKVWGLMQ